MLGDVLGKFSFQSAYGFRVGQSQQLTHLKPKFDNVKQEALNNKYKVFV